MYAEQYVANDLMDRTPVELVRLLYSKAIEKLRQAGRCTREQRINERGACLARVMEIIAELQGSLNLEAGGELALELAKLYDYVQRRLIEAAGDKQSVEQLEEVRVLLGNLREGWNECEPPLGQVLEPHSESMDTAGAEAEELHSGEAAFEEEDMTPALTPVGDAEARESRVWTL